MPVFFLDEWIACLLNHTSLGFLSFLYFPSFREDLFFDSVIYSFSHDAPPFN